jgi:hypothetical protein
MNDYVFLDVYFVSFVEYVSSGFKLVEKVLFTSKGM